MADLMHSMSIDATLGVAFVGFAVTLLLYGLNLGQIVIYLRTSSGDMWWLRSTIVILWLLDNVHVGLIFGALWQYTVSGHGDAMNIRKFLWPYGAQVYFMAVSNFFVRDLFAYRIWMLNGKHLLVPLLIGFLSAWAATISCLIITKGVISSSWSSARLREWPLYTGYGSEVLGDSIIAIAMSRQLLRFRTGFQSSDSIIRTFVLYAVNTGIVTIFCNILSLICLLIFPQSFGFMAFYFVIGKLYLNSLIGTLNARSRLYSSPEETAPGVLTTEGGIWISDLDRSQDLIASVS